MSIQILIDMNLSPDWVAEFVQTRLGFDALVDNGRPESYRP